MYELKIMLKKIIKYLFLIIINFSSVSLFINVLINFLRNSTATTFAILPLILIILIIIDIIFIFNKKGFSSKTKYINQIKKYIKNKKLNNIFVRTLHIKYNIDKNINSPVSKVNITTTINGTVLENDLIEYHLFCTKNTLVDKVVPKVTVENNAYKCEANIKTSDDINKINHFIANFERISNHSQFTITNELNNCYYYPLEKGDTYIIYPHSYGRQIGEIKIKIIFEDNIFQGRNIEIQKGNLSSYKKPENIDYIIIRYSNANQKCFIEYNYSKPLSENEYLIIKLPKIKK